MFYIINLIQRSVSIKIIYVSGWNRFKSLNDDYFISKLIKSLCKKIKVEFVNTIIKEKKTICYNQYKAEINLPKNKRNVILIANLNYNLKRIFYYALKKRYNVIFPIFEKNNFLKKNILKFLNIYTLNLKFAGQKKSFVLLKNKKVFFRNNDLTNLVFHNKSDLFYYFFDFENKMKVFEKHLSNKKINLIISNSALAQQGIFLEIGKRKNIKTLNIPHGILSSYFNKKGKIFNASIGRQIFSKFAVNAVQSKLAKSFVNSFNISKKNYINTGNLIFNYQKEKTGNKILYASTNKNFTSFRPIGFLTFTEFLKDLHYLNSIVKKLDSKIYVKPHPSEFDSVPFLKKKFKNLFFTTENNKKLFKKINILISFSSSMIEDALNSKVPVILLDINNRYKCCYAENNILKKNCAVYYVNKEDKLLNCIKTIYSSNEIKFDNYIDQNDYTLNLNKVFKKFFL